MKKNPDRSPKGKDGAMIRMRNGSTIRLYRTPGKVRGHRRPPQDQCERELAATRTVAERGMVAFLMSTWKISEAQALAFNPPPAELVRQLVRAEMEAQEKK